MKVSVYVACSLDGFIAREDGDIEWLHGAGEGRAEGDYGFGDFFGSVDALVMGHNTFRKVLGFGQWPYGGKKVFVLSAGRVAVPDELAAVVEPADLQPGELVAGLGGRGFNHLYIDGGATIQGFLRAGLIDEITITTVPLIIGRGIRLFGALERDIRLRHIATESFATGFVQSRYQVQ